jgi:DNA polymerase III subunit delta'
MSLDGIAGNRSLIRDLAAELARRPSPAYLFAGPAGVGKALVARALAHSLLCERSPGTEFCCSPENCPTRQAAASAGSTRTATAASRCDCCAACVQLAIGIHPDFVYIARNLNRTEVLIEQVRGLIEQLGLRPSRGAHRLAIIDDGEHLNIPAQNALLKTLEEPPGQTLIFVISRSERVLLDTVRSRMRPVRFGPIEASQISALLTAREGIPPERAVALARLARGSFGRALALATGEEPPITELIKALRTAAKIDFAEAHALAQRFFGAREQAANNFELIARLLEEMLCCKLLGAELNAPSPEATQIMVELAQAVDTVTLAELLRRTLEARSAIDEMANSRLQAENWWIGAGAALRGE